MKLKFKIIFSIAFIALCCLCVSAQNPRRVVRFDNDELLIYREIDDYDMMYDHNRIVFENKTNNRMRVTYKVQFSYYGQLNGVRMSDLKKFNLTRTLYIDPKRLNIDYFIDSNDTKQWSDFMDIVRRIGYREFKATPSDPAQMIVQYHGFELVNYGVEDKSYRTQF